MVTRGKRQLQWYTSFAPFASLAPSGQTSLNLYSTQVITASQIKGFTITRTLVDLRLKADSVVQQVTLAWGLVLINADAASAAVFPDPVDNSDRPGWLARG